MLGKYKVWVKDSRGGREIFKNKVAELFDKHLPCVATVISIIHRALLPVSREISYSMYTSQACILTL